MPKLDTIPTSQFPKDLREGQSFNPPLAESQIGGELLNILSKGLYTDPLDAIREYAQNSIDANAETVEIQVTGNSVFILDYGDGMDYNKLLQAREFAISQKDIMSNVGFRGIGIYSGFDLCNRLVIRTKTAGEEMEHILEFEFGEMRHKLDAARQDPNRPVIPLATLLHRHIAYHFAKSTRKGMAFTMIQLENLSDTHIARLSNLDEMRGYILRNLPVRFSSEFQYGKEIEKALQKNVEGYKSAKIILKIERSKSVTVEKPNIPDLESPRIGFVYDSNGKPMAYYWACLTSKSESLSSRGFPEFAGLVYKIKGFTIGDRNYLSSYFTRKQIYPWWTGEVYVISTEVIPTSARDDFEASPAKDALEAAVKYTLSGAQNKESLQKIALEAQASRRADQIIQNAPDRIKEVKEKVTEGSYDEFQAYSALDDILSDLQSQKGKASGDKRTLATRLITTAKNLQKQVKKEIDDQTPVSVRKRKGAKAATDVGLPIPIPSAESGAPKQLPILNLLQVITHSGWRMREEDVQIISAISDALADNIGINTDLYERLLEDIAARLGDLGEAK